MNATMNETVFTMTSNYENSYVCYIPNVAKDVVEAALKAATKLPKSPKPMKGKYVIVFLQSYGKPHRTVQVHGNDKGGYLTVTSNFKFSFKLPVEQQEA